MPYDSDPRTISWFERALESENPETRWRAIELLRVVNGPRRSEWLDAAERDPDPRVSVTAVLVRAALSMAVVGDEDLLESDFAQGCVDGDLEWEWEYSFVVCDGLYAPATRWLVWLNSERDDEARGIALLKANAGRPEPVERTAIIAGKRFVNCYTRSPRSFAEAMMWHSRGRPRYREGR